jgi:hypothetical protein
MINGQLWEQKMVQKNTSYGSEIYKPYLNIERIINVPSAGSVNQGHDQGSLVEKIQVLTLLKAIKMLYVD